MTAEMDGYVRVSRVAGRAGDSFISPEVQREQILHWSDRQGIDIAEWHEDLDESGKDVNRPGFQAMLARVERGETGGVVVARFDRFARSLTKALAAFERISQAGGEVVSVAENFDTTGAVGQLALNMMLSVGQFELERIRESWLVARARAVDRGTHR